MIFFNSSTRWLQQKIDQPILQSLNHVDVNMKLRLLIKSSYYIVPSSSTTLILKLQGFTYYSIQPVRYIFGKGKAVFHFLIMDKAGIANIEKENLGLQIQLLKAQTEMSRSSLSTSIQE
jgi:hypothetical protein